MRKLFRKVVSTPQGQHIVQVATRHHILPKRIWKQLPIEEVFPIHLPDGRSIHYAAVAGDKIGQALFWGGLTAWEPETIPTFYALAREARCTIDVGASTGIFTLLAAAANPQAQVLTFEPLPMAYARLTANIKQNGFQERCDVRAEAVADTVGRTIFHIPLTKAIPKSASLNTEGYRGVAGVPIKVAVTTLDAVCVPGAPVDLVKIDVENFEHTVLAGMQRILIESQPTLIVECNYDGPYRDVEATLKPHGYHFWHLRDERPIPVESIVPDPQQRYRNFLCVARQEVAASIPMS